MKIRSTLLLPLALAVVLTACGKTDNTSTPAPTATAAAPATTVAASTPAADSLGIPECDDYISKVRACVASKVPEAQRAQLDAAFTAQSSAFKQAAANPQAKAMLASQCKSAMDQAKTTLAAYGCSM